MSRLVLAGQNIHKLAEVRTALAPLGLEVISAADAGVTDFPPESGSSYEENALLKAGFAALKGGLTSLADDSGLEVDALRGAPGVYSARFGGNLSDGERVAHLLSKLRQVPPEARGAGFVCVLVLATPNGYTTSFRGECRGLITEGPRGASGFGYDPVFYSDELSKTFAEASAAEKATVSHRGRALAAFRAYATTPAGQKLLGLGKTS